MANIKQRVEMKDKENYKQLKESIFDSYISSLFLARDFAESAKQSERISKPLFESIAISMNLLKSASQAVLILCAESYDA